MKVLNIVRPWKSKTKREQEIKAGDSYSGQHSSWSSAPADGNVIQGFPDGSASPSSLAPGNLQIQWTSAHRQHKRKN